MFCHYQDEQKKESTPLKRRGAKGFLSIKTLYRYGAKGPITSPLQTFHQLCRPDVDQIWEKSLHADYIPILLAPHGAQAVIAFSHYYYYSTLLYYIFQIFSSNLSKPMSRGGINWSLCGSNSLGTSHSTQGRDDSSSSSIAGLNCMYCILVYIGVMSVRTSR